MGAGRSKTAITNSLKTCTLWKADRSPACRAVMMTLGAMNLSITEVDINMDKAEHRTPEMIVLNPLQTLPVFRDRELVLCDSQAINTYLASRYNDCGRLLPTDPGGALVDQLLHFNSGVLYPRYHCAANAILYHNCNYVMPQQIYDIECAYRDLENMLVGRTFGGSWPTLADISIAATVSTLDILVPIDKLKCDVKTSSPSRFPTKRKESRERLKQCFDC
ncbi:LOW QUALITY PROTEIN: glutathione S-transferase 1-like [Aphomia sociella]